MNFKRHLDITYLGDGYECYCTPLGHVFACRADAEIVVPDLELNQFFGAVHADPRFAASVMDALERELDPAADWRWTVDVEIDCVN